MTIGFIPISIKILLCNFDYKSVSSEKLAQAISALQRPFLKLYKTVLRKDCFIEVRIVNMIKESKFNWCSSHKL